MCIRDSSSTASVSYNDLTDKPDFKTVATSGKYTDLTDKPTLFSGSYNDLTNKPTLFSGSYNDLTNKPTIPTPFSGSYADLTNKPTLFSGSYVDLTNKPVLFSGNYSDLLNKPTIPAAYYLPKATASVLGGVKVDGTTITIDADGKISAVGGGSTPSNTSTAVVTREGQVLEELVGICDGGTVGSYAWPSVTGVQTTTT